MPNPNEWAGIFEFPFFARRLSALPALPELQALQGLLPEPVNLYVQYTVDNFVIVRTMYSGYVGGNKLSPTFLNLQLSFE